MIRGADDDLVRGKGRFVDDVSLSGQLSMTIVRSPVAHGVLKHVDIATARSMPGVRAVLQASDLDAMDIGPLPCRAPIDGSDGPMIEPRRPVLADGKVVHVGQAVVAVIAETSAAAMDAAETVDLDIDALPAVTDVTRASNPEIAPIWAEAPANRSFRWERGNGAEADRLIASAANVVRQQVVHPRIAISPLEPRGCIAMYDPATRRFDLESPSQGVVSLRTALAECLGIDTADLRVRTGDVGGSFAAKIWPFPEHVLALIGARLTGAPVKWVGTRSEAYVADAAGRGRVDEAELALDTDGRFLAFRIRAQADLGAFVHTVAPHVVTTGAVRPFGQLYDIPGQHYAVEALFTNAVPTDAYRGAGKPESAATLERLIDLAATELNIDRLDLRRRNLIRPEALPHATPMGETMDAGDFPAIADRIAVAADWPGLAARKAESRARGNLRGAGIGFHLHATGGSTAERSFVQARADGTVLVRTGAQDSGQGHRRALAAVAAEALEIPVDQIVVEQGDSAWLAIGGGSGGSNLLPVAANTVHRAAHTMLDSAKEIAAGMLETATVDLSYGAGAFRIVGTDRAVSLTEVARRAETDDKPGCVGEVDFEGTHTTFPNGSYLCEVEVDPATGEVRIDRWTGVDDLGRIIDDAGARGQIQGGIAQGIGEALMEGMCFNGDGQPLTASMLDAALPRADQVPAFVLDWAPTPSPNALLGAKGCGELAAIGAPGVVINAVMDALASEGVRHIDMPLTPLKIWQSLAR
ncbi:MAG: xanthine dehydrogenase family protein molybdopterin-binding subunit [Pseudomonadota bacterium]